MASDSFPTERELVGMSDEKIAAIDSVVMNLIIARGIESLSHLDIHHYVSIVDAWARDLAVHMQRWEVAEFHPSPQQWKHDLAYFRLGVVCWFVDTQLKIAYHEDQRDKKFIRYTDPGDLFLNGVIDSRRGTCGNIATLHVALGRRLGLPVSLACVGSHFVCRYDDGNVVHNVETTNTGLGGFATFSDEELIRKHEVSWLAQQCGSDLKSVTNREMLAFFLGCRARHLENSGKHLEAEPDYLMARALFPRCRWLFGGQIQTSIQCSSYLYEPHEKSHPNALAIWVSDLVSMRPWKQNPNPFKPKEEPYAFDIDKYFTQIVT